MYTFQVMFSNQTLNKSLSCEFKIHQYRLIETSKSLKVSEVVVHSFSWKQVFSKLSQISQENGWRPAYLSKRDFNAGAFLWNFRNFWEHLLWLPLEFQKTLILDFHDLRIFLLRLYAEKIKSWKSRESVKILWYQTFTKRYFPSAFRNLMWTFEIKISESSFLRKVFFNEKLVYKKLGLRWLKI